MKNLSSLIIILLALAACSSGSKPSETLNIDREGIRNTVLSNRKGVRNCYGKELVKSENEKLSGKMNVSSTLGIGTTFELVFPAS